MLRKIKDYLEFLLFKFFIFLFFVVSKKSIIKILEFLTSFAFKFGKKHKNIAQANLDLVYENKLSQKRKEEIIFNSLRCLIYNIYEFLELQRNTKEEVMSKVELINENFIIDAQRNKRKIIFISAHYGSWELNLVYLALKLGQMNVVAQKLSNPFINKSLERARNINNITMFDRDKSAKNMIKSLKDSELLMVAIDQHIGSGIEVDFLGQKVKSTSSTSKLALKFDAVIIPVFCYFNEFNDYTIVVKEPIDVKTIKFKTDDKIKELTQIQNNILSKGIIERPDYWLWQHKRFKEYNTEIYNKKKS